MTYHRMVKIMLKIEIMNMNISLKSVRESINDCSQANGRDSLESPIPNPIMLAQATPREHRKRGRYVHTLPSAYLSFFLGGDCHGSEAEEGGMVGSASAIPCAYDQVDLRGVVGDRVP